MSADPAALLAALELLGFLRTFAAFEAAFFDVLSFLAISYHLLSVKFSYPAINSSNVQI